MASSIAQFWAKVRYVSSNCSSEKKPDTDAACAETLTIFRIHEHRNGKQLDIVKRSALGLCSIYNQLPVEILKAKSVTTFVQRAHCRTWFAIELADKFQNGNMCTTLGICYTLILYNGFIRNCESSDICSSARGILLARVLRIVVILNRLSLHECASHTL